MSAIQVKQLARPGLRPVGGVAGLCLQITPSGARSWVLRATVGSKRRDIGLGGYPDVTLAQAREKAREMREQIREGVDPVLQRKAARDALIAAQSKVITFDEAARRFIKAKVQEFRNPKHTAQWETTLQAYASPVIGRLPVDAVTLPHIVQIPEPIWTEKTETATRLRGRIESVLSWATVSGFRSGDNPARWRGNLDAILPKPGKLKKVAHHKAVPVSSGPAFMAALREREGVGSRALEFLILTAGRSGEVRGATWEEIDMEARTWTVPAERMKAQREHVVPLCPDAVKLLKALPVHEDCPYVFPSPRGKQLSDATLSKVMKLMGVEGTPHGFRSTFRDWCAEHTNYPREVAEKALAHTIPSAVEAAYRRGNLMTKRTRLMQEWARFLNKPTAKGEVVSLRGKTA
ncbi:site-specific integrase [Thiohalobacter thiocyanaticus]|uniref:Site-specific integrase n=1 Tax=Thiohalobacter thiocyanaticus TaxID=585455 RepID=A0A426QMI7_9GAMM|nr:site-specific integrase [Thiohalobacter thiocyanaticus]